MHSIVFALIVYVLVGIAVNFTKPIRSFINHRLLDFYETIPRDVPLKDYPEKRLALAVMLLRVCIVLLYPIFLPGVIMSRRRFKKEFRRQNPLPKGDTPSKIYNTGVIRCKKCEHEERVRQAILTESKPFRLIFQCQTCSKFSYHEVDQNELSRAICTCGGALTRTDVLKCSRCSSADVSYYQDDTMNIEIV